MLFASALLLPSTVVLLIFFLVHFCRFSFFLFSFFSFLIRETFLFGFFFLLFLLAVPNFLIQRNPRNEGFFSFVTMPYRICERCYVFTALHFATLKNVFQLEKSHTPKHIVKDKSYVGASATFSFVLLALLYCLLLHGMIFLSRYLPLSLFSLSKARGLLYANFLCCAELVTNNEIYYLQVPPTSG